VIKLSVCLCMCLNIATQKKLGMELDQILGVQLAKDEVIRFEKFEHPDLQEAHGKFLTFLCML